MKDRFDKLVEYMLAVRNHQVTEDELKRLHEVARVLAPLSKRHHYIPEFFTDGFEGEDGMVYKYDKENDLLTKQKFSSKSVFFEWGRNSFDSNGIPISIIEDRLYSALDGMFAPKLSALLEKPIGEAIKDVDTRSFLVALAISFFWRSPISDNAFKGLFQESTMTFTDPATGAIYQDAEREAKMKEDPFWIQIQRASLFRTTIDRIIEEHRLDPQTHQLHEFEPNTFLIGDYPIVYRNIPSTFPDLMHMDYLFPISSRRLYASHRYDDIPFGDRDIHRLNAIIINQSKKMVISADYEFLEKSVTYWKMLKENIPYFWLKERLFDPNKNREGESD